MEDNKPVVCLMGTTATGKTDIAVSFVKNNPCEIISVDSAMVYREMNIGTAKPDAKTLSIAPHHLINICDPTESYSVASFRSDAIQLIKEIHERGHTPLLVGGTMLYFRALFNGLAELPKADPAIRAEIEAEADKKGWNVLHSELAAIDPDAAKKIHPNDPQRLQRALEVYRITGEPLTKLQTKDTQQVPLFNAHKFALIPEDRSWLHQHIEQRFHSMLEQGFVEEVNAFYKRETMHPDLPSMRSIGYRQVWQYIAGELNYSEMVERGIIATRQLAKRQLTWMRSDTELTIFDPQKQSQDKIASALELITK